MARLLTLLAIFVSMSMCCSCASAQGLTSDGQSQPNAQRVTRVRIPTYLAESMVRHEVLPKDIGIPGDVVVEVLVEKKGTVRKVRAVSGDARLVSASKAALMRWTFIPYFLNGEPIQFVATLTLQFDGKHGSAKLKPESDPILGDRAAPK